MLMHVDTGDCMLKYCISSCGKLYLFQATEVTLYGCEATDVALHWHLAQLNFGARFHMTSNHMDECIRMLFGRFLEAYTCTEALHEACNASADPKDCLDMFRSSSFVEGSLKQGP